MTHDEMIAVIQDDENGIPLERRCILPDLVWFLLHANIPEVISRAVVEAAKGQ